VKLGGAIALLNAEIRTTSAESTISVNKNSVSSEKKIEQKTMAPEDPKHKPEQPVAAQTTEEDDEPDEW
jgi:hypothetical protein